MAFKFRLAQAGNGRGRFGLSGLQKFAFGPVGNVNAGEDDLLSVTLEGKTLYKNGVGIEIIAYGTFAANGNNKQVKLYFGGNVVIAGGVVTSNNKAWYARGLVVRSAADVQKAIGWIGEDNVIDPTYSALAVDDDQDQVVKVTGEAVATDDIVAQVLLVNYLGR